MPPTASTPSGSTRLWPFQGPLPALLDGGVDVIVETYPREFYRHFKPAVSGPGPWSKRRQEDRRQWVPTLLTWAEDLGVQWDRKIVDRVEAGFSSGVNGEDEFDATVGLLGMIAVVVGRLPSGEPAGDPAVAAVEGWILGRAMASTLL